MNKIASQGPIEVKTKNKQKTKKSNKNQMMLPVGNEISHYSNSSLNSIPSNFYSSHP